TLFRFFLFAEVEVHDRLPRAADARLARPGSRTRFGRRATAPRRPAARTTTFTDSPRLRLRLARPHSQTRLACGCGSHDHIHRLASPAAAARTTTITDSPRLRLRLALPQDTAPLDLHALRLVLPAPPG